MKKTIAIMIGCALAACAEVPFDANGQVIVPATANFAEVAQEGLLDRALDELIIKITPGSEEIRTVAALATTAFVICQIRSCRPSRGRSGIAGSVVIPVGSSSPSNRLLTQLEGYDRTQIQIGNLAKLSSAIAIIAERDSASLTRSAGSVQTTSWIALYEARLDKLQIAKTSSTAANDQLREFRRAAQESVVSRALLPSIVELQASSNEHLKQIDLSILRLRAALSTMNSVVAVQN